MIAGQLNLVVVTLTKLDESDLYTIGWRDNIQPSRASAGTIRQTNANTKKVQRIICAYSTPTYTESATMSLTPAGLDHSGDPGFFPPRYGTILLHSSSSSMRQSSHWKGSNMLAFHGSGSRGIVKATSPD